MAEDIYREVPVEQLRFGMYVVKLDRPWTETPFKFQGFLLRDDKQLKTLKAFCQLVYVDPERSEGGAAARAAAPQKVRGETAYPELASVEKELAAARTTYAETRALVEDVVGELANGKVLDGRRLGEAVGRVADSIVRNPDAMMLLTKMIAKGSAVARRALDVSVYMIVFGRFLQLPRESLETLGLLGLLQDIGKVRLPSELLDKTTTLNVAELELAKNHVQHSVDILREAAGLPPELPDLAALHHERQDGSGYPKGLKGSEIGLIGSIAGIVDTFDALTTPRAYAQPVSPSNALTALFKGRNTQFSAALVEQFIQCIGVFPVGSVVELSTGEIGVVIAQNLVRRLQPRVMVVMDAEGRPIRPHKILDLMKPPMSAAGEPCRIRRTLEYDRVPLDPREFFL